MTYCEQIEPEAPMAWGWLMLGAERLKEAPEAASPLGQKA